ncbi:hypothetical protein V7O61_11195 [Methanolobus sp. WCC1]|uniref:hypothetical protein n=1 Tax=unclassified Methanolobus TaxID=2629569 RepID=UPI003249B7C3
MNIEIEKTDKRLRAIQADIQKLYNDEKRVSCISDEEIMAYVKKYFMFNQMVSKDMHRKDMEEGDNLDEGQKSNDIKPCMHDTID